MFFAETPLVLVLKIAPLLAAGAKQMDFALSWGLLLTASQIYFLSFSLEICYIEHILLSFSLPWALRGRNFKI
jgi:hypothetical protein